ncbi:hypothetical protein [Dactylosporangium sp. CA-139066]|uniref:hypothetical protein n=1 Tax=Dactylosporangium sp. CA-139066 TaxID=3239930 RepID=UPI003D8F6868
MRLLAAAVAASAVLALGAGCDATAGTAQAGAGATSAAPVASPADPARQACLDVKAVQVQYFTRFNDAATKTLAAINRNDQAAAETLSAEESAAAKEWGDRLTPLATNVADVDVRSAVDTVLAALRRYSETQGVTVGDVLKAGTALTTALNSACG